MEQRPLRLGDIVDDYCPRERRITNHAIVAIVDDTVKQTRCTTCDHEHVFKHAREPRRRKKDEPAALYAQVLSGLQKGPLDEAAHDEHADDEPADLASARPEEPADPETGIVLPADTEDEASNTLEADAGNTGEGDAGDSAEPGNEIWPMHRRLIRAQLPRTGNEPPAARPLPDFTIRQPGARGGSRQWGRGGQSGGGHQNGNHAGRGGQGSGGQRPGRGGRFAPPRPDGPRGGRPGGGRGRRSR